MAIFIRHGKKVRKLKKTIDDFKIFILTFFGE